MKECKKKHFVGHEKGLFVGLCTKDILFYTNEIPRHNHKSRTEDFSAYIGGPAANAAITYAMLGGDATLATCLGNSRESLAMIEEMEAYGVTVLNYSDYDTMPNMASIFISDDGKRTIISGQHPFTVNREYDLEVYDFVLFDCNQQEISLDILLKVKDKVIVLDAGSVKPNIELFLKAADIVISSEDFMDEKGNDIFAMDCRAHHKAVTRGECPIRYNGKEIPVERVDAVDTLGAGDIFHGAFCYSYFEEGKNCEDALCFAAKIAGESVKYRGPRKGIDMMKNKELFAVPEGFDAIKEGVTYGKLMEISYDSGTTGTNRKANIILPPRYDESKKYPVLYLLHGIGGDHNEWLGAEPVNVLSNLVAEGEAKEMIVVIPNVRARANDAGDPQDIYTLEHYKAFDNFINDLRDDLMPYIEANYPVLKGKENTAVAGLSMGGRESLFIGCSMPEVFGYIGAFTPAPGLLAYTNFGVSEDGLFTTETLTLPKGSNNFVMINAGISDEIVSIWPETYHKTLDANGVENTFYVTDGGHDFTVWKNGLYNFAKKIFK